MLSLPLALSLTHVYTNTEAERGREEKRVGSCINLLDLSVIWRSHTISIHLYLPEPTSPCLPGPSSGSYFGKRRRMHSHSVSKPPLSLCVSACVSVHMCLFESKSNSIFRGALKFPSNIMPGCCTRHCSLPFPALSFQTQFQSCRPQVQSLSQWGRCSSGRRKERWCEEEVCILTVQKNQKGKGEGNADKEAVEAMDQDQRQTERWERCLGWRELEGWQKRDLWKQEDKKKSLERCTRMKQTHANSKENRHQTESLDPTLVCFFLAFAWRTCL